MNICIPSQDGRGLDSEVHGHFGSAPWFTFVNTGTGEVDSVANPACGSGGGNCHHVGMLASRGVEAVFSSGMGRRAWSGLKDAGIEVYAAPGRTVRENVGLAVLEARRLAASQGNERLDLAAFSLVLYGDAASEHRRDLAKAA